MAKAVIDGQAHEFEPGVSILEASRAIGVDIPTLCHDERLKPIGSCRMCLVEIERKPHPVTACNTLLTDGMVILNHTPALENERRMLLKMLAQDLLDISSGDANRLKLQEGERVRVRSRCGEATLPIRITSTVKPGELFATFHTAEVFLNSLTSPHRDRYVKSPEYKVTAVKIEKK